MAKSKDGKGSGKAASQKKTGVKKAKKALARAEESVAAARKAVKASRKNLRRMVSALSKQTERLSAKQAKAVKKSESAKTNSRPGPAPEYRKDDSRAQRSLSRDAVPAVPTADAAQKKAPEPTLVVTAAAPPRQKPAPAMSAAASTSLTPPLPSPQPASATLVELRQQARETKIPGYSRLNKAELIKALEKAQKA